MVLPIVAYGHPALRKVCVDITPDYPHLKKLIDDLWETMYASNGVGLAAPQVNKDIRLFIIDSTQILANMDETERAEYADSIGIKQVFINAHVAGLDGKEWSYNEGCLSIPKIREDIFRREEVTLKYVDENFEPHSETFNGITARVILHEYDHIEGKLFIDYLPPLKKKLMRGKLADISKGKISVDYKMMFPKKVIMKRITLFITAVSLFPDCFCQQDSADAEAVARMINLSEVVMRSDLNVPKFIERIKNDTTFYKAFRNLHILGFTSLNDIRMTDKNGNLKATLQSKTRQKVEGGCRTMDILEEKTSGNIYNSDREFNYYTAELYAGLFFTKGRICGENNIVKGIELSTKSKKGIEKNKEQLKMMFFNPGKKIPGIPFIGNKINIFDPDIARYYDFKIDLADYDGQYCYIFSIRAKDDLTKEEKDNIVFDNMTTWFNSKTMEIVGRDYDLSYNTGVYDFDVHMEVLMTKFREFLVPKIIRYNGQWDVAFKKRERGVFTATLFDFEK